MTEKIVNEEFNNMICKERNISHYLMATPFSTVNNMNYGETLKPDFFAKNFLVYDELREIEDSIIQYLDDISQNTVLITGYQGCGKTTFVNFLAENLKKHYMKDKKISGIEVVDLEEQDDQNSDDEEKNPFKRILINKLIDEICVNSEENELKEFLNGYRDNPKTFKIVGNWFHIQRLFMFLKENLGAEYSNNLNFKVKLYELLRNLTTVQILTMWSYYIMCRRYCTGECDFVDIIVFDNIDDIYNDIYTEDFIRGIKKFHELGSRFAARLKLGGGRIHFNMYSNFNFIFCLRDTSAAKFSYHFVNRAVEFFHVDISKKVNKKEVMNNKINYLENIQNEYLRNKSKIIRCICNDNYTVNRIFPFYNNDYRTAIRSLCKVLDNNEQHAREYFSMTYNQSHAAFHFGAHGIILRIILDSFEKQGYFRTIGSYKIEIPEETEDEIEGHDLVDYSIPRVILTYLFNYQEKHRDNFLNNLPNSTINMRKIFDDLKKVIYPENIADKLEAMYSLHLKKDWNHLLTINATYEINASNINSIFDKYKNGEMYSEEDGSIQITCAGRMFVRRITTHYEYFACRYFPNSKPLFLEENLLKNKGIYRFDKNITDVFDRVKNCIDRAYIFDLRIAERYYKNNMQLFKKSHYLFGRKQTHAERIINHNISYIDAYRHYIIQRYYMIKDKKSLTHIDAIILNEKNDICKCILDHIREYVELMKIYIDNNYFSDNAVLLYRQYTVGLENIGTNYLSDEFISFKI